MDAGDRFQKETRYQRGRLPGGRLDPSARPRPYKEYPDADRVELPVPEPRPDPGLFRTLAARRSVRRYGDRPLTLAEVSCLAWAAAGVTRMTGGQALRTAPSAGALYPVETYVVAGNVRDFPPGVYHYFPLAHCLERLRDGDLRGAASAAALDQSMAARAAAVFVFTAVFARSKWKYGERAFRYIYLDAGHMGENLALAATGLSLGSCAVGAIYDDEADALLGLSADQESVICMVCVGSLAE